MATMSKEDRIKRYKARVPKFRVSFPHLWTPTSMRPEQPKKYSITMLWEKKTDLKDLRRAIHNAAVDRWGPNKDKWPKKLKMPIHDGDDKADLEGYAGCYHAAARSAKRPGVLDAQKNPVTEDDGTIYAATATVIAFTFPKEGEKGIEPGVGLALQNVMKLADGEEFSGRRSAEDDFKDMEVEDDSENPDNFEAQDDDEDLGF
jgi:hypothetical protein